MIQHLKLVVGYAVVGGLAAMLASTLIACGVILGIPPHACSSPTCDFLDGTWTPEEVDFLADSASLTALTEDERWKTPNGTFNDNFTGPFSSYHGYGCAPAARAGVELPNGEVAIGIRIQDSISLPSSNHTGMVYLNGWSLEYGGGVDHHVGGLGAWITNVHRVNNELHWEAGGILADKNADDPYEWCYYYTVMIWDATAIDAFDMQENLGHSQTFVHAEGATAALRTLTWRLESPGGPIVAAVPRGYGLMFDGYYVDHHLLQAAFDLDAIDRVVAGPNPNNRRGWTAEMILKDNSTRSFFGTAMVSAVGGSGVRLRKAQNFDLQPFESTNFCGHVTNSSHSEWVTVPNLSFDFAVPVLAGWNIGYPCEDHHVKTIGAWIEDWSYFIASGASTGTLRYKVASVLRDKNADDGMGAAYKVNILGFNKLGAMP